MVRCVVHVCRVTESPAREDGQRFGEEDDDDVCEGRDEGDAPDQCDQSVGSLHSADLDVMKRSTNSDVTLHRHAGEVQRAVPGSGQNTQDELFLNFFYRSIDCKVPHVGSAMLTLMIITTCN